LIKSEIRSGFVLRKIPDEMNAASTSLDAADRGPVYVASLRAAPRRDHRDFEVTSLRFTAAHHDDVVAMQAAEDASAAVAGPITTPTVGRTTNAD
jgi:hypothetical protein